MSSPKDPDNVALSAETRSHTGDGRAAGEASDATGVIGAISRFVGWLSKAALLGGMMALFLITAIVTVDVMLRTFVNISVPGASEIAGLLQAMMVFLGLAYTLRAGQHIKVDMFVKTFPEGAQRWLDLLLAILALAVFVFVTYAMYDVATGPRAWRESSDLLAIRLQPFKIAAAVGTGLMCLEILDRILRLLPKKKGPVPS
ncbi:MAG: TRAP transporter small permease [Qingshengfaniella sp.]